MMKKNSDTAKGTAANGTASKKASAKKASAKKPVLAKRLQPSKESSNNLESLRGALTHCGYTCRSLVFEGDLSAIHGQVETGTKDSINFKSERLEDVIDDFRDAVEDYMELLTDGPDIDDEDDGACCMDNAVSADDDGCCKRAGKPALEHCSSPKMFQPFVETTTHFAAADGTKHETQVQASQANLANNINSGVQSAVNFHFQKDTNLTRQGSDVADLLSRLVSYVPEGEQARKFIVSLTHVLEEAVNTYIAETEK